MNSEVNYGIEELVPVVGMLVKKYTSGDSTSVSYEKAEQLMEAVLYCIAELERSGNDSLVSAEGMSARRAYELGLSCVRDKVKKALALYHEILPDFSDYGNACLHETFLRGLPQFFQNYDIQFEPQNTILTLDYPVLKDISAYTGIDKVYAFILCVSLEQKFLHCFPEEDVIHALTRNNRQYKQAVENLCEPVFTSMTSHLLAGKTLSGFVWEEADDVRVKSIFRQTDIGEINQQLEPRIKAFVGKYCGNSPELMEYLSGVMPGILLRLKHAPGKCGKLCC